MGEEGSICCEISEDNNKHLKFFQVVPSKNADDGKQRLDTLGAGDHFLASLLYGWTTKSLRSETLVKFATDCVIKKLLGTPPEL